MKQTVIMVLSKTFLARRRRSCDGPQTLCLDQGSIELQVTVNNNPEHSSCAQYALMLDGEQHIMDQPMIVIRKC